MMMVAMNPTKTVRPMATVAPNPDTVSVSKLDRNLSAEPSCSSVSGWVENLVTEKRKRLRNTLDSHSTPPQGTHDIPRMDGAHTRIRSLFSDTPKAVSRVQCP